jgi:protein TonB
MPGDDDDSTACSAINPIPPQEKAVTLKKITKGMIIHKVEPSYPAAAKRAHIQGAVILCANIGKNGKITFLQAASGPPELIPAAMKAVKKWRYKPYLIDDEPVELHTTVKVVFALAK